MLTQIRLKQLLRYNARTGHFVWLVDTRRNSRGSRAGGISHQGRIKIGVEGKRYYASRLAFLYMRGYWPPAHIDHRNGKPADDRWSNLRLATASQNLCNMRTRRAGLKGVKRVGSKYFMAKIQVNYKTIYLGCFATEAAAHAAYVAAARRHHGDFARSR